MKLRALQAIAWSIRALAAACLTSCAYPPAEAPAATHAPAAPRLLAQIGHGSDAAFVLCVPPQCPARTPKTLASPEAPPSDHPLPNVAVRPIAPPRAAQPGEAQATAAVPPPGSPSSREVSPFHTWTVPFAFGSAQLGRSARQILQQLIAKRPPSSRITIAGRTDSTGPAAANDVLSHARAIAVRDYLVRARPELAAAMQVQAAGKCCFVAPNDTPAGRALNRRVEIAFEPTASPP